MAKFEIPKFRYIAQDFIGHIYCYIKKPGLMKNYNGFVSYGEFINIGDGKENPNWRDTLIDLETDDYDFENGILRRIEK